VALCVWVCCGVAQALLTVAQALPLIRCSSCKSKRKHVHPHPGSRSRVGQEEARPVQLCGQSGWGSSPQAQPITHRVAPAADLALAHLDCVLKLRAIQQLQRALRSGEEGWWRGWTRWTGVPRAPTLCCWACCRRRLEPTGTAHRGPGLIRCTGRVWVSSPPRRALLVERVRARRPPLPSTHGCRGGQPVPQLHQPRHHDLVGVLGGLLTPALPPHVAALVAPSPSPSPAPTTVA